MEDLCSVSGLDPLWVNSYLLFCCWKKGKISYLLVCWFVFSSNVWGALLRAFGSLYDRCRILVHIACSQSDLLPMHFALWQGCSCYLFWKDWNVYIIATGYLVSSLTCWCFHISLSGMNANVLCVCRTGTSPGILPDQAWPSVSSTLYYSGPPVFTSGPVLHFTCCTCNSVHTEASSHCLNSAAARR